VVKNAKAMAEEFMSLDYHLISGGTDTHVMLLDLTNKNITGKAAENALEKAGITVNKNMIPFDQRSPFITSGIRIGTPAITTRGMGIAEMRKIVKLIGSIINDHENEALIENVKNSVHELCANFPLYDELKH
ncbi:MAG: serine hydroxymethyltransferase, partial [Candidatus Marinimicrobia bacterium]|nr:serine hydroxymethyltransferase [Candidatus Neomarinimicrobiota bacterium]